jgi:regulator of PEP synthase PpsR (kinase-PPPase family)
MTDLPQKPEIKQFYVHLVSDATGNTLQGIARATFAQFEHIDPVERFWPLVRSERQLERVITDIQLHPGPVFFTLVDAEMRNLLTQACKAAGVPALPVLDSLILGMSAYLQQPIRGIPGLQHALDEAYFGRIDAMEFALNFDDGQSMEGIESADVILVGVSRTSKTPTCIFLARRGIRAANIPFVPGVPFPEEIAKLKGPLFVGLTENPERLAEIRRTRVRADGAQDLLDSNEYLDLDKIEEETRVARRYFSKHGWPVIDVTRRSIEETAAEIQMMLSRRNDEIEATKKNENL